MALQSYAQVNQAQFTRLADWEGIIKARTIPEFDKAATCAIEKFETADAYYRWCSAASYTEKVSIPLLVISALDDPVCTAESIPWHECRANKNIVLATTKHGGHLGFFEGITASGLWWVRAANEFLDVLHSTPHMDKQKKGPYINVTDANEPPEGHKFQRRKTTEMASNGERLEHLRDSKPERV